MTLRAFDNVIFVSAQEPLTSLVSSMKKADGRLVELVLVVGDYNVLLGVINYGDIIRLLKDQNPSILISKAQITLSEIGYDLQKGLRLPSLNSSVNYSANSQIGNELLDAFKEDWNIGINLTMSFPVYVGNSLSLQQQQA